MPERERGNVDLISHSAGAWKVPQHEAAILVRGFGDADSLASF